MDEQTAKDITQAIRDVGELKLKFIALEQILASERPALYVSCKVLCHNLVVLIHEMYELGIDPVFWRNAETVNTVN